MLSPPRLLLLTFLVLSSVAAGSRAEQAHGARALTYDGQTRGPVPIPPSERGLQAVVAEPWFKVSDEGLVLQGPAFDRDGNLLFCDVSGRRVLRLTPDKRLSTVVSKYKLGPGGLAVHKDGRIFIAAMDIPKGIGSVVAVKPDGSGMQAIVPLEAGLHAERPLHRDERWGGRTRRDDLPRQSVREGPAALLTPVTHSPCPPSVSASPWG